MSCRRAASMLSREMVAANCTKGVGTRAGVGVKKSPPGQLKIPVSRRGTLLAGSRGMERTGSIVVKRAYEAAAAADGYRVLVERLWSRGLRKDDAHLDA